MPLTPAQQEAVVARGNVLVVAGAGTGKTRALVERCLHCLLHERPPVALDEMLVVTFTEAAAAEIRQRIRERLEQERRTQAHSFPWDEQLALFESAHIGTLHSFCLQLVRQHFYQLELDPQLTVLAEEEARLLAQETLEELLRNHYGRNEVADLEVQRLIQIQARGWDKPIRAQVLRLHHYTQSLPNPEAWLEDQLRLFGTPEPSAWRGWFCQAVTDWARGALVVLESLSAANPVAARCVTPLRALLAQPAPDSLSAVFGEFEAARKECPRQKITLWLDALQEFFADVEFLGSLVPAPGTAEPLAEDWSWVRDQMSTLLQLAREFTQAFAAAKRELGVVDFHDLEQHSLRLLWDHANARPTSIARQWRQKLRFVFVDEYQDINPAQDLILRALSREGDQANRFLVGDAKQSIYRFRLADPRIFRDYAQQWALGDGRIIPLVENFRSREAILSFVNSVFGHLLHRDLGGLEYDSAAALRFGSPGERRPLSLASNPEPCVELRLLFKAGLEVPDETDEAAEWSDEVNDLRDADKEARLVGLRLRELRALPHHIWDEHTREFRPVDWKDMAILLRSPAKKAQSYAKEFARLGIPLQVARAGFYQSSEVSDLLSLLQLLDNPLQDLPVLAVLHSPLVGLTANELAQIRLAALKTRFWVALLRWHRANLQSRGAEATVAPEPPGPASSDDISAQAGMRRRVARFLDRFARWRRLARQVSLSRCLEIVLAETQYDSWLLSQPRGTERHANVQRLLALAQEFDRFQRQGLFRFLQFVEAQKTSEIEPEVAASPAENAVRLMSIHQSKGLEFGVLVVADLGKAFNQADLRAAFILDEQYGLCPQIKPPHAGKSYPSLPYWLARKRQRQELLGEELRLLYVAMTRARDLLILSGSISQAHWNKQWLAGSSEPVAAQARNYADWLACWFSRHVPEVDRQARQGSAALLRWFILDASNLAGEYPQTPGPAGTGQIDFASAAWRQAQDRMTWKYPFAAATQQPAKTSVSVLRRQASEEVSGESSPFFAHDRRKVAEPRNLDGPTTTRTGRKIALNATEIGSAHHQFLQWVDLGRTDGVVALRQEARRLEQQGRLLPEQVSALNFEALASFWNSALGQQIRMQPARVHRELAFTARFSPAELAAVVGQVSNPALEGEFVLAQGVVDLAVIEPEAIRIVDFKTDQLKPRNSDELSARIKAYEPQLSLYAQALERIYRRPVAEAWLYFLVQGKAVQVLLRSSESG